MPSPQPSRAHRRPRPGSPTPCEVALAAIADGKGPSAAAREAGVSRMTVHRWLAYLIRVVESSAA